MSDSLPVAMHYHPGDYLKTVLEKTMSPTVRGSSLVSTGGLDGRGPGTLGGREVVERGSCF